MEIKQTIYKHGGSRIWIEIYDQRHLIADTYASGLINDTKQLSDFAKDVRKFIEQWMVDNGYDG